MLTTWTTYLGYCIHLYHTLVCLQFCNCFCNKCFVSFCRPLVSFLIFRCLIQQGQLVSLLYATNNKWGEACKSPFQNSRFSSSLPLALVISSTLDPALLFLDLPSLVGFQIPLDLERSTLILLMTWWTILYLLLYTALERSPSHSTASS